MISGNFFFNIFFKNVVITKQKKEYWNVMDLNAISVQKEKNWKNCQSKAKFFQC